MNDKDLEDFIDLAVEDPDRAEKLLEIKPDLLARRTPLEETALNFLAVENYPFAVDWLCKQGAEVDTTDFSGATPLFHAVKLGYEEMVKILLSHGANPNTQDNTGDSALERAMEDGSKNIIEMLTKAGATR